MKKTLTLTAAALAGALAAGPALAASPTETCSIYAKLGRGAMQKRQQGYPEAKLMQRIADSHSTAADLMRDLIQAAYAKPRFYDHKMQKQAADDFANTVFTACYRKLAH
jgi:hypothetical protein